VPDQAVINGKSRLLTETRTRRPTCEGSGQAATATIFASRWSSSSLLDGLGRGRRVKAKPHAVASRAWTRRPRSRVGSYEADGGGAGHEPAPGPSPTHRTPAQDRRAISGPLTRVTRGQSRLPGDSHPGWSAPLAALTAALPNLIVRVRFSSPAPRPKAQAREDIPAVGLDRF
jgi:hypothetical protein